MSGLGTSRFGLDPFGGAGNAAPHGRVYASVLPALGTATLAASRTGFAKLAANPRTFAALTPSAGFSTLQTD